MFYWFIRALFYLPIKLFYPTKIIGKENLVRNKSIYICNHQSNLDGIILGVYLPYKIHFLSKAELFKTKLSSWFFTKMELIKVNRGKADIKAVKEALTVLKQEGILGIFPSGTRTNTEEEIEYKNGTAMFAVKSGASIVPMRLIKKPKIFCRNTLVIGKPFTLSLSEEEKKNKDALTSLTKEIKRQEELLQQTKGEK